MAATDYDMYLIVNRCWNSSSLRKQKVLLIQWPWNCRILGCEGHGI